MMKHILLITVLLLCLSILFLSCDDETHPLVGTWNYTEIAITNCNDSGVNDIFDYSNDGFCETAGGMESCTKITLTMTVTDYTISEIITTGGVETTTVTEEGTYKLIDTPGSNIQFCTDILCRAENYGIINRILSLESTDFSTDCVTNISATKR